MCIFLELTNDISKSSDGQNERGNIKEEHAENNSVENSLTEVK